MTTAHETFRAENGVETFATPETLWAIFRDAPAWRTWNAGVEHVELEGPFAQGTWFTMKPPGQDALRSRLVEVRENEVFVDETRVGDLVVTVTHRIERQDARRTRVTYAIEAAGAGAKHVGPMIAADFPEVLASLASLAERKQS